MIGRGLFVLTILSNCVLSLPVTSSQLENEDVQVMKCVVEALADVLSRPRPNPVTQECLVTLKTDDRLVSILRHHNFLKELQQIAVRGDQERAQLQRDAGAPEPNTHTPQTADDVADRSMLEALGGPGERSILSQKRRAGNGDGEEEKDDGMGDGESQEEHDLTEQEKKRGNDESRGSRVSESEDEWSEGKAEKREEEDEDEEKRVNSESSEEENLIKDKKGAGSGGKRAASRIKSKENRFDKEDEEEKDKRSTFSSHKPEQQEEEEEEEDEGEMKRDSLKPKWTKRGKVLQMRKKAFGKEAQQEVSHHSQEATEEEEEEEEKKKRNTQRSPEEKELQMIARRGPEERRGSEEEGSASRKSEEPEIESLAAIESELENVAQKLHEMRRG